MARTMHTPVLRFLVCIRMMQDGKWWSMIGSSTSLPKVVEDQAELFIGRPSII